MLRQKDVDKFKFRMAFLYFRSSTIWKERLAVCSESALITWHRCNAILSLDFELFLRPLSICLIFCTYNVRGMISHFMHAPCIRPEYVTRPSREVYYVITIFTKIKFVLQILVKILVLKFHKKKSVRQRVVPCGQTDGWTAVTK